MVGPSVAAAASAAAVAAAAAEPEVSQTTSRSDKLLQPTTPTFTTSFASEAHSISPSPNQDGVIEDLAPPDILNFSDVSSNITKLTRFAIAEDNNSINTSNPASGAKSSPLAISQQPTGKHQARKPSPGLAARLKALGFGEKLARDPSPSAALGIDHIGRLPEDQLRLLDETHQANSASAIIVEKRGRPWKGGPPQFLRSASDRARSKRERARRIEAETEVEAEGEAEEEEEEEEREEGKQDDEEQYQHQRQPKLQPQPQPQPPPPPQPPHLSLRDLPRLPDSPLSAAFTASTITLPEVVATPPLEMDTNKFRLPEHTNGNGTKSLFDTKREHIDRDLDLDAGFDDQENEIPPPPLPKDTPPRSNMTSSSDFDPNASYFDALGIQRPGSIYTISRLSFANQLAQLTGLQLPDAASLSSKISAIPTAQAAVKALISAAEQIRMWIHKASDVIDGLDGDNDVEWAAAGGREGYEEVENAIARFEELINVYVGAMEKLQSRNDISSVTAPDLTRAVKQMETIMQDWVRIRETLKKAKGQVEIAMEWEELWNSVFGEIQNELDDLCRLVFEMEERRHKSLMVVANGDSVDIGDLETIVEETPPTVARNNRFSLPAFPPSPSSPPQPNLTQDDSSLLALFARMQPLRASLDFLPMRLSVFEARAEQTFPSACEELEERRETLEDSYKKLEKDAESLRKELGEDKWVLVFRGAGRQAQKMYESVERSVVKLREAVDSGMNLTNPAALSKKIESFEAKKTHYGPAIERVLSIIDKGVQDRLTVNGEILRLHAEMQAEWVDVKNQIRDLDSLLEEVQVDSQGQALRDSVSSMLSYDRSTIASGHDTPGSSPPSSVVMSGLGIEPITPASSKTKTRSASMGSHLPQPSSGRRSGMLAPPTHPRRTLGSRLSTFSNVSSNLSTPPHSDTSTPPTRDLSRFSVGVKDNRPRWNGSVNTRDSDIGHNFKPLSLTTPSPYAKQTPTSVQSNPSSLAPGSAGSKIPQLKSSPLSRATSLSPALDSTPTRHSFIGKPSRDSTSSSMLGSLAQQTLARHRLHAQSSTSNLKEKRWLHRQSANVDTSPETARRSASSLSTSRRTSYLPQPRHRPEDNTGRNTPQALAGARSVMRTLSGGADTKPHKPRWHF